MNIMCFNFIKSYNKKSDNTEIDNMTCDFNYGGFLIITEFADYEILRALKQLNPNKTVGPDNIPVYIVRSCAHVLSNPLKIIFNSSIPLV